MTVTAAQFRRLRPRARGYSVYMLGERKDQPNVPAETNPYRAGSPAARAWDDGQADAAREAQDTEED